MNPIRQLHSLGQSLWYDNIQRCLLDNGEMAAMISRGEIRGVTSNPSIFQNAIAGSHEYDAPLSSMAWAGWDADQIFWQLAIEDIRRACDLFRPLYDETHGGDGYVSLEVNPALAHNTEASLAQARHLWDTVKRSNLMIKIPATLEGILAVQGAIAAGINVNVTLIFSIERYRVVMDAYLAGLEERLQAGLPVKDIASVASFFISRMDTKVDSLLVEDSVLRGKAAIANAKLAYAEFRKVFEGERFTRLRAAGCRPQRPLWASTSTKNPAYPDTLYIDNLIGPETINTVPPQTLDAFRDHGQVSLTLTADLDEARRVLSELKALGISMARVTQELEEEGVQAFAESFSAMLGTIEGRRAAAAASLGPLAASVGRRVARLEADAIPARIWEADPTVWTVDPKGQDEIQRRLGWLRLPETSRGAVKEITAFTEEVHRAGIRKFLLLGMGGSSLAPEVLSLVFSHPLRKEAGIGGGFAILDSTDPAQVIETASKFPPAESLYIVSSKSGGTAEVNAMLDYFWKLAGGDGSRFIAITDPGTSLDALANARGFRKTFLADATVGGRFSALSHFGLVPAALMGVDLNRLLDCAADMMRQCRPDISAGCNPGLVLGGALGEGALSGRDKLTVIADKPLYSFGSWLEQLIAESSGKQGKGIVVVDGEPAGKPSDYGNDRLFVYFRQTGEFDPAVVQLRTAGDPVLEFPLPDSHSPIPEFYRWEFATAVACAILGVNAFDQPDVQDNKDRTKAKIASYSQYGKLEESEPSWERESIKVFSPAPVSGADLENVLKSFLAQARGGYDYIAINAYLPRNEAMDAALTALRLEIRRRTGCATTVGFGPRFLHSTGQLHKGGPDSGLFLQITTEPDEDLEIPNEGMTFGVLERAQALGDYEALVARQRRILSLHLPMPGAIERLVRAFVAN